MPDLFIGNRQGSFNRILLVAINGADRKIIGK